MKAAARSAFRTLAVCYIGLYFACASGELSNTLRCSPAAPLLSAEIASLVLLRKNGGHCLPNFVEVLQGKGNQYRRAAEAD